MKKIIFGTILLVVFYILIVMAWNWQVVGDNYLLFKWYFVTYQMPIGLFFIITLAVLLLLFFIYVFFLHTSLMLERRKFFNEILEQKKLVDGAEDSRLVQILQQQTDNHKELVALLLKQQHDTLEWHDQLDKSVEVAIESLEDRLLNNKEK